MRKLMKTVAILVATTIIFTGCGKTNVTENVQSSTSLKKSGIEQTNSNVIDEGNVESSSGLAQEQSNTIISTYEDLKVYQTERMEKLISAFESSGISYCLIDNKRLAYNTETSYQVLNNEYRVRQIGCSQYDAEIGEVNTIISYDYEFHPEKGLVADDENMKLLFELIQTIDNSELKEKYASCEELVSELSNVSKGGSSSTIYKTENTSLSVVVEEAAIHKVEFAAYDRISCNIEQPEKVYMEFETYDEYVNYLREEELKQDLGDYIMAHDSNVYDARNIPAQEIFEIEENLLAENSNDDSETVVLTGSDGLAFGLSALGPEQLGISFSAISTGNNPENSFEITLKCSLMCDDEHYEIARKYLKIIGDYFLEQGILPQTITSEEFASDLISRIQREKYIGFKHMAATDLFDFKLIRNSQYPQLEYYENACGIYVPVKVEGLLNR